MNKAHGETMCACPAFQSQEGEQERHPEPKEMAASKTGLSETKTQPPSDHSRQDVWKQHKEGKVPGQFTRKLPQPPALSSSSLVRTWPVGLFSLEIMVILQRKMNLNFLAVKKEKLTANGTAQVNRGSRSPLPPDCLSVCEYCLGVRLSPAYTQAS